MSIPTTPPRGRSGVSRPRRLIDATDEAAAAVVAAVGELTAQVKLANQIEAVKLGASTLAPDTGARASTPAAVARLKARNALRAEVRAALGLEVGE